MFKNNVAIMQVYVQVVLLRYRRYIEGSVVALIAIPVGWDIRVVDGPVVAPVLSREPAPLVKPSLQGRSRQPRSPGNS